jgi:hypothetical protein
MTQIKKDDVMVASGGWECTFPTFYKVIDVKNNYVTLKQLRSKVVSHEPFCGTLGSGTEIPTDDFAVDEKVIRRKIKQHPHYDEQYVVITKSQYLSAHIWDGKPKEYDYRNI